MNGEVNVQIEEDWLNEEIGQEELASIDHLKKQNLWIKVLVETLKSYKGFIGCLLKPHI